MRYGRKEELERAGKMGMELGGQGKGVKKYMRELDREKGIRIVGGVTMVSGVVIGEWKGGG